MFAVITPDDLPLETRIRFGAGSVLTQAIGVITMTKQPSDHNNVKAQLESDIQGEMNLCKNWELEREMAVQRVWSMPNKWTFLIPPFKQLLQDELTKGVWIDPFAGKHSPATVTNDLNRALPANSHLDALTFLQGLPTHSADGALYDPPYSITQAKQCYDGFGTEKLTIAVGNMGYWSRCKNEIARIIKLGGKVICFGWNSMGIGKTRGFSMKRVLICAHGGSRNDTICTVELKIAPTPVILPDSNKGRSISRHSEEVCDVPTRPTFR
jgi:hypothetical protein